MRSTSSSVRLSAMSRFSSHAACQVISPRPMRSYCSDEKTPTEYLGSLAWAGIMIRPPLFFIRVNIARHSSLRNDREMPAGHAVFLTLSYATESAGWLDAEANRLPPPPLPL